MAMTQYEQLCDTAYAQLIEVFEHVLPERVRGLYYENELIKAITVNKLIDTTAEKYCVLAEEIGHSIYGGDLILNTALPEPFRRRCEHLARTWAYKKLIPARKLISALKSEYYLNSYEIAEEFDVTEEFLAEAIEYYKTTGAIPMWNNSDDSEFP